MSSGLAERPAAGNGASIDQGGSRAVATPAWEACARLVRRLALPAGRELLAYLSEAGFLGPLPPADAWKARGPR
jgi:hypothetical protein